MEGGTMRVKNKRAAGKGELAACAKMKDRQL